MACPSGRSRTSGGATARRWGVAWGGRSARSACHGAPEAPVGSLRGEIISVIVRLVRRSSVAERATTERAPRRRARCARLIRRHTRCLTLRLLLGHTFRQPVARTSSIPLTGARVDQCISRSHSSFGSPTPRGPPGVCPGVACATMANEPTRTRLPLPAARTFATGGVFGMMPN